MERVANDILGYMYQYRAPLIYPNQYQTQQYNTLKYKLMACQLNFHIKYILLTFFYFNKVLWIPGRLFFYTQLLVLHAIIGKALSKYLLM